VIVGPETWYGRRSAAMLDTTVHLLNDGAAFGSAIQKLTVTY